MIERGRRPTIGGVALRAVVAEVRLRVVGFHRVVEVRLVARFASCWRSSEAIAVTLHAVHAHVLAREREARVVVVEGGRGPGTFVMAECAVRWEASRDVVRVRRSVVVRQVTAFARVRRVRVTVRVALVAVDVRV